MRRLPLVSFSVLVVATVGAFFVTQHLKVTTPLLAGFPRPVPGVINPYGASCGGVDHSAVRVSFYLLNRSDTVDVSVVDSDGAIVRTLASGLHMGIKKRTEFVWNGRLDNGQIAPDGTYYIRVALLQQGRTFDISNSSGPEPVKIKTTPPHPVVTNVSPALIPLGHTPVTIHYRGNEHRGGTVVLYRTDLPGDPVVKRFKTPWNGSQATWDGLIDKRPAPAGTYLVGLNVTDAACNTGKFPALMPPVPGSTVHAGVSVRYLAAQPPLTPVPAGSTALVYVDSRSQPYRWTLWRVGAHKPSGRGAQRSYKLRVKLPAAPGAGLYQLVIASAGHRTAVPLIASDPTASNGPRVLVVLPALTWQAYNPVDDPPAQDGVPNTLPGSGPIQLDRVLATGLPGGFTDKAAFLSYLDRANLPYDLTTDLGLIDGVGPQLAGHTGVVLAGSERWIPASLGEQLRSYVENGGHLLSLGVDSLLREVKIRGATAFDPTGPAKVDALAGAPGAVVTHNTDLITVIEDRLRIFTGTSGAFQGYRSFQPIRVTAPGTLQSAAGTTNSTTAIVGYRLGRGVVVDIGLVGFGSSIAHNVDAKELVSRLWTLLRR